MTIAKLWFTAVILAFAVAAKADVTTVRVGPETASIKAMPRHLELKRFAADIPKAKALTYQPKYATIGHTILQREAPLGTVTDEMFKLVDALIDEAKTLNLSGDASEQQAKQAVIDLDLLLIRHGFVYPPVGLTNLFSDGLVPRLVDAAELQKIQMNVHNTRRTSYIQAHPTGPYYYVDCDTASFLYLAIADELKLPLFLVEVPEHNFVRWYFKDNSFLNWETMDGLERNDTYYKIGYAIPSDLVKKGVYLSKMETADTLGYCRFVVGLGWEQKRQWQLALDQYILATKEYSRVPGGWNNAAWVLTTARDSAFRDGKRAVEFALKAVAIYRSANLLDTLGCAYAEAGDFSQAIAIETEASQLNPGLQPTLNGFQNHKTWIEQNPEKADEFRVLNANR